ncbi:RHS repeat-associated core domain-containing protein [Actinomadura sp. K4S16]|uniref:RHS repeat-associated core domain-containing protein n=1 Tax=Actinomadura sp. K4S16 TaxID=1316147 RepID=UPI0011EEA52F|nr:RHS repeat-associated core domain-containing protein [Actinomadura sp. K4S16]
MVRPNRLIRGGRGRRGGRHSALFRAVAVVLVLMLVATLDSSGISALSAWRDLPDPHGPKQAWGSAKGRGGDISVAGRNRTQPRSLRSRYPLNTLKKPTRPPRNSASVVAPLAPDPEKVSGYDAKTSRELPERRDAHARTYVNTDGTESTEVSPRPINYRRPDGSWAPIDTRVLPVGAASKSGGAPPAQGWRNAADSIDVRLAPAADAATVVRLGLGGGQEIGYSLQGAAAVAGRAGERGVTYPGVRPDTDLKLDIGSGSVKETLVLRSSKAPGTFVFPLSLKGLSARVENGQVLFTDATGRTKAVVPAGSMTDSAAKPATSSKVSYSLVTTGGVPALKVTADPQWLSDPARVFPVDLDPSVEISGGTTSLTVDSDGQTGGGQVLTIGAHSAAYLGFPGLSDKLKYHKIFGATLWMLNYDSATCRSRPVSVRPVTEAWAGQSGLKYPGPSVGAALARESFSYGHIELGATKSKCPFKPVTFNLGKGGRDLIQRWVNGTQPNYGLSVRDESSDDLGAKRFTGHDTVNPPRLIVTHSPYNASYAITDPVPNPPVTQAQSGKVKVTVTNTGSETWTPSTYYLGYRVYDDKGKLVTQQRSASLPGNVARGGKATLDAVIKPLPPGTYSIDFTMVHTGGPVFTDEQVPPIRLRIRIIDIAPVLQELYPLNGYQAPTLNPQLWATAVDLDAPPGSSLSYKYEICEKAADDNPINCFDSGYVPTYAWTVPDGKLSWNKTYLWRVFVKDAGNEVPSPRVMLQTVVPQPEITAQMAQGQEHEFEPSSGNYSTSVTDASVTTVGPELSVERTYNSLDPRRASPFGAGWTTRFDMRLTEDGDGSGNVVIDYPDGQQVRFGKNPDGTYAPPLGRQATLTVEPGKWKLTDKAGTVFEFVNGRLTSITDAAKRAVTLTYDPNTGKLARATATGNRTLTFTWSGAHVTSVSTAPVDGKALTWNYTYTGDLLTKVCGPASRCTTYDYTPGSHYRTTVLDDRPDSYWRLGEKEGVGASSQVAVNLGKDGGTYKNVTLQDAGALAGTDNTAAAFNGSSSQLDLPAGTVKKSRDLAVEVWFKNKSTGSGGPLIGYQDKPLAETSTVGVPALYTGTDGKLHGQFWSGGTISPMSSTKIVNDGKWHHAVLSAMGSTQTLYVDGQQVATLTGQTPNHLALTQNQIGAAFASTPASWPGWGSTQRRFYNGTIDEAAIYHHPLGPAQVAAHYANGLTAADQLSKVMLPSGKTAAEIDYDTDQDRVGEYTDGNGGTWKIKTPTVYGGATDLRRAVEVRDPADRPYLYETDALTGQMIRVGIPMGLDVRDEDKPQPATPTATPSPTPTYVCTTPDPGDPAFCTDLPGNTGGVPDWMGTTLAGMGIRTFEYDDQGHPTTITNENGDSVKLTYDARGNILTRTTCRTKDVCYTARYTFPTVTNPSDPRNDLPIEYRDGRSTSATDNRYKTSYTYTTTGDLQVQTNPQGGGQVKYTFTTGIESAVGGGTMPSALVLTETDPRGAVTRYAYTSAGDLAQVTDPSGLVTKYTYDAIGRLKSDTEISDSVPAGAATYYGYDDWSNLTSVTEPATTNAVTGAAQQQRTDYTYDTDGNLTRTQVSNAAGSDEPRVTTYDYDDHNLIERVTDAHDHETGYDHDRFGNLTALVDAAGNRFEYAYTARNMLAEVRLRDFDGDPEGAPDLGDHLVVEARAYDYAGRLAATTDAMGRRTEYTYYGDDLPKSTILKNFRNPDGTKRDFVLSSYEYDGAGNATKLVTGNGKNTVQNVYDNVGRVESSTLDPGGIARRIAYQYDAGGNITQETSTGAPSNVPWSTPVSNETTTYAYDTPGRVKSQTVSDGSTAHITSFTYDQRDLLTSVTDPRGNADGADKPAFTTTYRYDEIGRQTAVTSPPVAAESGGNAPSTTRPETTTGFDAFDEPTESKDPLGNITRTEYDRLGQPVKEIAPPYTPPGSTVPLTPTTTTYYDPLGQVEKVVDPRQNETRYTYDRLGRVHTLDEPGETNDDRSKTQYTYTRTGEILSTTDPSGARTEATYDDLGRASTATELERNPTPAAYTTHYTYDDSGNLLTTTSPTGAKSTATYDSANQLTKATDAAGTSTQFGYDGLGRQIRTSDGLGRTERLGYDTFGRLARSSDLKPDGTEARHTSYEYDLAGNLTGLTDPLNHTRTLDYDALNRLVKQTEPVTDTKSITTTFGYDAAGNRTRFTDGRGNATVYTVNSLGLPESIIEPSTSAHPEPVQRTWTSAYDAAGNPVKTTAPGGVVRERAFDAAGRLRTESGSGTTAPTSGRTLDYDPAGRLTKVNAASGTDTYGYDDRGLLTSAEGPSGTASWTYNGDGQPTVRSDAAGTANFGYLNGRLKTVQDGLTGTVQTLGYNAAGQPDQIDYGAGRIRAADYDDLGRITGDTLKNDQGSIVASVSYTYDDNDQTTSKTTAGTAGAAEQTYGYDQAGRLTSWSHGGDTTHYEWDDSGNRTKAGDVEATFDQRNRRLTNGSTTYTYTPRGTLATESTSGGPTTTYDFDAFDRLTTSGGTTYTYDGLDRPATRNDTPFTYAGLGTDPVADGGKRYARGPSDEPIATTQGLSTRITLSDKHDDVFGTFDPSKPLTTLTDSVAYDPFGNTTATTGTRPGIGYQGDWTDPETGQINMGARWYDPSSGSFTTRDTATLDPADGAINANRYTYANGDPLNTIDPTGHWGIPLGGLGRRIARTVKKIARIFRPGPETVILRPDRGKPNENWCANRCAGPPNDISGWSGGGGSGGGGGGRPGGRGYSPSYAGPSRAELEAARRRAQKARTDKAKRRASRKAQRNAIPVPQKLRGPDYAVPGDRSGALPGRAPGRTSGTKNVVNDNTAKQRNMRRQAIAVSGDPVANQGPAALIPVEGMGAPFVPGSGTGGASGSAGSGSSRRSAGGNGAFSWTGALRQANEFMAGLLTGVMELTPLGPILMIPGVKESLAGAAGFDAKSGSFKAGGYVVEAVSLLAGGGGGAARVAGEKGVVEGGGFLLKGVRACTGNSFVAGTGVLMADGSRKPIEDVKTGDKVEATDPETGKSKPKRVTGIIRGHGEKILVKITVDSNGKRGVETGTVTATEGHPFWVRNDHKWIVAADLKPGMWLRTSAGTHVQITATKTWNEHKKVYNLSVETDHTYYVEAGDTPVLVHNAAKPKLCFPEFDEGKTAAHAGGVFTLSGYADDVPTGFVRPSLEEIAKVQESIGKARVPFFMDNSAGDGAYYLSHAEKQAAVLRPGAEVTVTRRMCDDCFQFFTDLARATKKQHTVIDPSGPYLFKP